jgi:hypothetical protein
VDLELVEHARRERELGRPRAMDQHVPFARGRLGACHRIRDIVDVRDQLPARGVARAAGQDEDRNPVVVAVPLAGHLERAPADDDRAGRHQLGVDLAVDARRPDPAAAVGQPLVQALPGRFRARCRRRPPDRR